MARPLWQWLAWRFIVASVLPLLLVAALLLQVLLPPVIAGIEARHEVLARAIAGQVEEYLRGAGREMSTLAAYIGNSALPPGPQLQKLLDTHGNSGAVFAAIYLAADDDAVLAVALPPGQQVQRDDLIGVDLSRWSVLHEARQRQAPVWSEVFLSAVSARLAVSLAIPVGDRVLIGEVAINRLAEFLGQLPTEAGMLTMVLDRRGQVIAHSQSRLGGQQINLGHLPIVEDALQGRFDRHDLELDGERFMATLVQVPQLGWTVLVAQPRLDALRPFQASLWILAAGVLLALLLGSGATLLLARRLAQRIGRYTDQTHAIAGGDYGRPWPLLRIKELDQLAADLDRMSQAIRQREQALRASETRFRDLSALASDWFWEQDEEFRFTYVSAGGAVSALAENGFDLRLSLGRTRWELPNNLGAPEWQAHRRLLEARQPFRDFEYALRSESGSWHWVAVSGQPLFDDAGRFVGYRGTARDITRRQQVDEALRQAKLVVENSPAVVFRWRADAGWPTVFVSDNIGQFGYAAHELLDGEITYASLIHPDDVERVARELLEHAQLGRDHFSQEYRIVTRSGAVRWVDDLTAAERDEAGTIRHYQGVVIDISERKRVEEELRRLNRQLRMVSDCNQALIRARDEGELLTTVCSIVVHTGGYRMAWVGYAERDAARSIRPAASAGHEAGYLDQLATSWADGERGRGANGEAIRSGRPCVIKDLANEPRFAPWRTQALERGYAALCALPLREAGRSFGSLSIYAAAVGAFDQAEVALLGELADDLAFGISVLRIRDQRDRVDAALRDSEARYRLLFDSTPHPMWVFDAETLAFLTVNQAAIATYGYSRAEFLNMSILDLGADERTPLLSEDVIAVEEVADYTGFWRHRRKDGELIDVEIVSHALSYEGRRAELVLATDITERRRSERALLASEMKYRELVENANSIILRWTPKGEISFINEFGIRFFGYTEEELIGHHVVGTIVPPAASDGEELLPLMERICQRPEDFAHHVNENMRRGGERVWVSWTNRAVFNDWGQVIEVFSVGADVTEHKRAEAAVRESEERFAKAFHSSPAPMAISAIDTGVYHDVNEQMQKMLCYSRAQLVGSSSVELGIWADSGARERMVERVRLHGACREMPARFRTSTGEIREALYSGEIIRLGEKEVLLSLIFDVTDRKRAEEELLHHREHLEELVSERTRELRQAMEQLLQAEKLAALGNLVAGVAHELNTPLGNSRVVASLLAEELRAFATAVDAGSLRRSQVDRFLNRGREAVDLLERNSARAADLIGHFKQVAVDQSSARRRVFDLRQTVEEMLSALRFSFKNSPHRIDLDIPAGLLMDSYPGPLEQVIANLVGNAVSHGLAGVDCGRILLQATAVGDAQVLLSCADDGVGMPSATLKRIFEPFFTTRLGQGGSGLGLYIVYNLVTGVLGGTIAVDSAPGKGSTFRLSLPCNAPERRVVG
ncbi:MAG: PAS domain S-box protein [Accumulibacter sp.]|uniref:PAS domain S-box protein n=1 Tax=Accumulibacter sp. TaxID=2053492 RepID=UPI002FC3D387